MVDLLANLDDLLNAVILRPIIVGGDLPGENLGHALLILDPIASLSWGLAFVDYCAVLTNKTPAVIQIFETVCKKGKSENWDLLLAPEILWPVADLGLTCKTKCWIAPDLSLTGEI